VEVSKPDIWMPLYIGEYLADTMRLTTVQHGAYLLLLMQYWKSGPLPDDDDELAAIVKMEPLSWAKISASIRRFFYVAEDGLLHQKRADEERAKAADISVKRRNAAMQRTDRKPPDGPGGNKTETQQAQLQVQLHPQLDAHARVAPPSPSPIKEDSKAESLVPSTSREPLAERTEEPPGNPGATPSGEVIPFVAPTSNSLRTGGWQWTPPEGPSEVKPTEDELACIAAWNDAARRVPNLLPSLGLDVLRLRKLRAALQLVGGKAGWLEALKRVEASPLWRGETGGLDGWRPSIGTLLKPSNLLGLLEGTHDMAIKPRKPRAGPRHNPVQDLLDKYGFTDSADEETGPVVDAEVA
jgi:uncharacterized protein YdaU (DUF1376 family)